MDLIPWTTPQIQAPDTVVLNEGDTLDPKNLTGLSVTDPAGKLTTADLQVTYSTKADASDETDAPDFMDGAQKLTRPGTYWILYSLTGTSPGGTEWEAEGKTRLRVNGLPYYEDEKGRKITDPGTGLMLPDRGPPGYLCPQRADRGYEYGVLGPERWNAKRKRLA